jgi:preprotein translocase subunit SecG
MAIILPSGFIITNTDPVDSRITLSNQAARYGLAPANIYPGLTVYQQDVKITYVLINTSNVSNSSGWVALATAGSNQFSGSQVITGSLDVTGGITGSLFGTSSLALANITTASISANTITFTKGDATTFDITISQSGSAAPTYQIVTGSVTATVDVDPAHLFLIKSGSTNYFNIASDSTVTSYSNLFVIKNFTTQQPVFTVSESVVLIATQSVVPTPNYGGFWFTATDFYVGLEDSSSTP